MRTEPIPPGYCKYCGASLMVSQTFTEIVYASKCPQCGYDPIEVEWQYEVLLWLTKICAKLDIDMNATEQVTE